jgi:hypothetical protein
MLTKLDIALLSSVTDSLRLPQICTGNRPLSSAVGPPNSAVNLYINQEIISTFKLPAVTTRAPHSLAEVLFHNAALLKERIVRVRLSDTSAA